MCQFLERNGLLTVIRGHEAQDAGSVAYCFHFLATHVRASDFLNGSITGIQCIERRPRSTFHL